jgi:two-component system nitrogen regulation sensor histidine kinase NtrY
MIFPEGGSPVSWAMNKKWRRTVRSPLFLIGAFLFLSVFLTVLEIVRPGIHASSRLITHLIVLFLFNIDFILAASLLLILFRNVIKAYWERKTGVFGAGFKWKLIGAFLMMVLIPSVLLFVVGTGFLNSSAQRWFSFPVSGSVLSSLDLITKGYENRTRAANLLVARDLASELSARGSLFADKESLTEFLDRRRRTLGVSGIEIYRLPSGQNSPNPSLYASSSSVDVQLVEPSAHDLSRLYATGGSFVTVTGLGDLVRGVFPFNLPPDQSGGFSGEVVVDSFMSGDIPERLDSISRTFHDYARLSEFRNPIRHSYILLFFMITMIIVFGAVWFGIQLARRITEPIGTLEKATEEVARGNLSVRIDEEGQDEFALLIHSFNQMTADLLRSDLSLKETNDELKRRREYMETVLEHIGSGVLSTDGQDMVTTFNHSAGVLLGILPEEVLGKSPRLLSYPSLSIFMTILDRMRRMGLASSEEEILIERPGGSGRNVRLRINRLNPVPGEPQGGAVMVFDDVTAQRTAERSLAWQEVAQRIAHEIKNPLTPIRLSAERLQRKFDEKSEDFPLVFKEAIQTIVDEVQGMKHLVDEFSGYARLPRARPEKGAIVPVLNDVVTLYRSAHKNLVVECSVSENLPLIRIDRAAIRRVFVNLFENAIQAMGDKGRIDISVFFSVEEKNLKVIFRDHGPGISPEHVGRIFLPYFSTKKQGMGLGLAIVHRIVQEHDASIEYTTSPEGGAIFTMTFPVPPGEEPLSEAV